LATTAVSLLKNTLVEDLNGIPEQGSLQQRHRSVFLITALSAYAFLVHGYHPFSEDGGLYLAGIKRVLAPGMYPHEAGFVLGHLRFSLFAPALAFAVRVSGLNLEVVLLLVHWMSIWITLWAAWMLAERCFQGKARVAAVALLATWLTLPVAGTSLMLMDPYVTARSISTPCTLLALVFALDLFQRWQREYVLDRWTVAKLGIVFALAATMHPLMAAYGFGCVLALGVATTRWRRSWIAGAAALCAAAVIVAAILRLAAQPESSDYRQVAMSRYYWFLSRWQWYEWLGLLGPMAILTFTAFPRKNRDTEAATILARMSLTVATAAVLVALLFAWPNATNLLVARLQPLRIFQIVYVVMILIVGAQLSVWLGNRRTRWAATFLVLASIMFLAERETFPSSAHIEMPDSQQKNAWVQAFEWIRNNTPKDALFALDADYITKPGEDAQSFRAIAERSALPDYSKDGGEAAITPSLTAAWRAGQTLQSKLSDRSDHDRIASLQPAGVSWVVLARGAVTALPCRYTNAAVKVCPLPAGAMQTGSSGLLQAKR